jgi:hypothetical protein
MSKYFILTLFLSINYFSFGQQTSVWFFQNVNSSKNIIGLGLYYQNTISLGLNYTRIQSVKNKKIALQLEASSPLFLLKDRNKDFYLTSSMYIFNSQFNVKTQIGTNFKMYSDVFSKGEAGFIHLGLFPGYYNDKFFVATEFSYKNNLFTSFRFKETYTLVPSTVLYNTNGFFNFGTNFGCLIKDKFELSARLIYYIARDFKNYSPYTQNIGISIGMKYYL